MTYERFKITETQWIGKSVFYSSSNYIFFYVPINFHPTHNTSTRTLLSKLCTTTFLDSTGAHPVSPCLLPQIRPRRPDICHDFFGILGNLFPIPGRNSHGIKERRHQAHRRRPVRQILPRIVQIHARRGVDGEKGQRGADGLDPHGAARDAGEEFLQRRAVAVGIDEFGGRLTARDGDDVAGGAPFDDVRQHDGGDDELAAGVNGGLGVGDVHDGAAADQDGAVVASAKVGQMVQAIGSRQGEFADLEATVNGGLHGFGAGLGSSRTQDGTSAYLGKFVQDGLVVFHGFHAIQGTDGNGREGSSVT
jgi:hypothetical protein